MDAFLSSMDTKAEPLIGYSLGGRVALEIGMTAPSSVSRMVLLCPSPAFRRLRQFTPLVRLLPPDAVVPPLPMPHRAVVGGIRAMFSQPERLAETWYDAAADEHLRVMRGYWHRRAFFSALKQIYMEEAFGDDGFW